MFLATSGNNGKSVEPKSGHRADNDKPMTNELITNDKQALTALKQHGGKILWAILAVLAIFFAWQFYQKNYAKIDTAAADDFMAIGAQSDALALVAQNPDLQSAYNAQKTELISRIDALVAERGDTAYAWQALMIKARLLADEDDYQGAAESLQKAMAIPLEDDGLLAIGRLQLASVQLAKGEIDAALDTVQKPIPQAFEASRQEVLGDIYTAQNQDEKAKEAYNKAWDLLKERRENRALLKLKMEGLGLAVDSIEPKTAVVAQPTTSDETNTTGGTR